jgi:hypothetical protein
MKDEALKLAYEALEFDGFYDTQKQRAIAAIKQALAAQPAPVQPLTWLKTIETPGGFGKFVEAKPNEKGAKPVYLTPPTAQQAPAVQECFWRREGYKECPAAQPAPVQEPVASLSELQKDAANLLFALHDAWPYVHGQCTIESKRKAIQALIVKHGEFADLHPPAQPAPVQERTDYAVHLNHCNIGECEGVCKYLDDDCPALEHADMKAKWDRPTPPAARRQWVGLTDLQIDMLVHMFGHDPMKLVIELTQELKEENT